jgi:hypothetical protein
MGSGVLFVESSVLSIDIGILLMIVSYKYGFEIGSKGLWFSW